MTTAPAPLLTTLPRRRPRRRAPAERTIVVPLEGDLELLAEELNATPACLPGDRRRLTYQVTAA
jgi:hypothetical protein